jgi:hypothetical protein
MVPPAMGRCESTLEYVNHARQTHAYRLPVEEIVVQETVT